MDNFNVKALSLKAHSLKNLVFCTIFKNSTN